MNAVRSGILIANAWDWNSYLACQGDEVEQHLHRRVKLVSHALVVVREDLHLELRFLSLVRHAHQLSAQLLHFALHALAFL